MTTREFERIALIRERLGMTRGPVDVGIGDDCAILPPQGARTAISVDTCIEGVHFRRPWLSLRDIGWRSQVAAMSDLAAVGATPGYAVLALALPANFGDDELLSLVTGVREAKDVIGYDVVGGNLSGASELSLTTTVVGAVTTPLLRSGAKVGDGIFVTGPIGGASLGLAALLRGVDSAAVVPFIERWRKPLPRFDCLPTLLNGATAAIDLSDGLLQDLGHVCDASKVGARIVAERIPRDPRFSAACAALGLPDLFGVNGGEDYELLFTARMDSGAASAGTCIGTVVHEGGVTLTDGTGAPIHLDIQGFTHFQ